MSRQIRAYALGGADVPRWRLLGALLAETRAVACQSSVLTC